MNELPVPEFDAESLTALLREKGAFDGTCPVCDGGVWQIPRDEYLLVPRTEDAHKAAYQSTDSGTSVSVHIDAISMLSVLCASCGFTRLFHLGTLLGLEGEDAPG